MADDPPVPCVFTALLQETLDSGALERLLQSQHRRWQHLLEYGEFREAILARAWERRGQFQGDTAEAFLAWLRKLAWSVAVDTWRERKRYTGLLGRFARFFTSAFAVSPADRLETRDLVEWLLAGLAERERKVLLLKYFDDKSTDEIAQAMGTTREAVLQLHYRAIVKLRERLKKTEDER